MLSHSKQEIALATALTGLAGFVDATGYVYLGGYFVSFMNGNTTRAAVGAANLDWRQAELAAGLIFAFVCGVVAGSSVSRLVPRARRLAVLSLVTALLVLAASLHTLHLAVFLAPPLLATAMGAENAVFERGGEVSLGVTYMTGTLVKIGQHLTRALFGEPNRIWARYLLLWCGLTAGGVLGALSYLHLGLGALWIAASASLCAALAVRAWVR
ncbi:MAG: YoaK family protein [Segniliparus sp.]|uniref:YoaK family protein n=1 Tax=Segniliparus sp. TaxID=2804064 RepID=UPI003F3CDCFC